MHRHRIAPQIASQLTTLEAQGRLRYHAGHVRDLQAVDGGWQVAFRPKFGVDADSDGRIRDHAGRANDRFFALGTLRIGQAWESVAIPELRKQAQAIAAQIITLSHPTMRTAEPAAGSPVPPPR